MGTQNAFGEHRLYKNIFTSTSFTVCLKMGEEDGVKKRG
jgi:hypothetical protein